MKKYTAILLVLALLLAALSLLGCSNADNNLTQDQAKEKLAALMSKISFRELSHAPDNSWVGNANPINELPDIEVKYPLSVDGGSRAVEIFSSTEKSSRDGSGWLDIQAKAFNRANNGMSVSVRPIASGSAIGYITSRTYTPDAYSPANPLWVEILTAKGVSTDLITHKLVGNTAGILMKPDTHKTFIEKYKSVTIDSMIEAVLAGDLVVAHTDPNVSSTGLNIMTSELAAFDRNDPFSTIARDKMQAFSEKVPPVSPTTAELVEVANKGLADAILSEHQAWQSDPSLRKWVYTPMGVRHDSPLYALGSSDSAQEETLKAFAEFCLSDKAQNEATALGFNPTDGYAGLQSAFTGRELQTALEFWKQNKDAGRTVLSVFVADRSGSMEGEPLNQLKDSLLNGSYYINENNYVGLVSYGSKKDITIDLPIAQFDSAQHSLFYGAVRSLESGGATATNDALLVAMNMLVDKQEELGATDAKLRVFLLSDGEQNEGFGLKSVRGVISGLNIPIYTIGYNANVKALSELSSMNEAYFTPAESSDVIMKIKELFTAQL